MEEARSIVLRAATDADTEVIAHVWHGAWGDGHIGHVPAALHPYRTLQHFLERVPPRIASTSVAVIDSRVVGFVTVHEDELEQIFVSSEARGTGAASKLLAHGEAVIAERFELAWLAVVAGNARALHFYEREGWHDAGAIDYAAEIQGGELRIPTRRYEKRVASRQR